MYHPWPSMEFAMTTYKLDPLVARPGPSMAMDGMLWSLSTGYMLGVFIGQYERGALRYLTGRFLEQFHCRWQSTIFDSVNR